MNDVCRRQRMAMGRPLLGPLIENLHVSFLPSMFSLHLNPPSYLTNPFPLHPVPSLSSKLETRSGDDVCPLRHKILLSPFWYRTQPNGE